MGSKATESFSMSYRTAAVGRVLSRPAFLASLLVLSVFLRPAISNAAVIVVKSTADENPPGDGFCSLREAINNANTRSDTTSGLCVAGTGNDTITFNVSGTITLGSSLPNIVNTLTIDGSGQAITITGTGGYPAALLSVNVGASLTLNNLTIANGDNTNSNNNNSNGGAINNAGALTVTNTTFSLNSAVLSGGAIYNTGALNVSSSTFASNSATGNGGAIFSNTGAAASVTNATFFENSATGLGGALYNSGSSAFSVSSSTFFMTSTSTQTGIDNAGVKLIVSNTILDNTTGTPGTPANCTGTITPFPAADAGYNISSDTTCNFNPVPGSPFYGANGLEIGDNVAPGNMVGLSTMLGSNGGPTQTLGFTSLSSGAILAVPGGSCATTDQRGAWRIPQGFSACTIGAYEFETMLSVSNASAVPNGAFNVLATLTPLICASTPQQIIFTFLSNLVAGSTDVNGNASALFFAPNSGGTFVAQASYAGMPNTPCGPASGTALVTVSGPTVPAGTTLSVANATASPGSSFTATATLASNTSSCTSNQPITFTLESTPPVTSLPVNTGPNGVASVTLTAPSGNPGQVFLIQASYPGNSGCAPSTNGGVLTLGPVSTTTVTVSPVTAAAGSQFTAVATVVSTAPGCTVPSDMVTFAVETQPIQVATVTPVGSGGSGVATSTPFTAPASGTFQIVASFPGGAGCAAATGAGSLTVTGSNATASVMTVAGVTATEGSVFTAAAELEPGACAINQQVNFTFQNQVQIAITNANGVANASFTAPGSSGNFPIQASFAGTVSCTPVMATGQVIVPAPSPTRLTVRNVVVRPGTLFTASAALSGPSQCTLGLPITFTFNGSPATSNTGFYGTATTSFFAPGVRREPEYAGVVCGHAKLRRERRERLGLRARPPRAPDRDAVPVQHLVPIAAARAQQPRSDDYRRQQPERHLERIRDYDYQRRQYLGHPVYGDRQLYAVDPCAIVLQHQSSLCAERRRKKQRHSPGSRQRGRREACADRDTERLGSGGCDCVAVRGDLRPAENGDCELGKIGQHNQ